jgi:hypothetical protein
VKNPLKRKPHAQIIYTPFDLSDATPAPGKRRFWKQVLPNTTINYRGRKIKFDNQYHMDLADAFRKKAFDQVPVVFANDENAHNMDPRNFGGDVLDMAVRDDGLYALVEADKSAAKEIKRNPKLGVSARIREAVSKADGRSFPRAIEHICLTMNPRVTGMSPWEAAVDLSDEDADIEVVDLTSTNYGKEKDMRRTAKKSASSKSKKQDKALTGSIDLSKIDLSEISDEAFEALLDLSQAVAEDEDLDEDLDDDQDVEERRRLRRKKSKTKITVEKDSESDDPEGDEGDPDDEGEGDDDADLSDADRVLARGTAEQVSQMRIDLAEERWERDYDSYVAAGVPAFLLDLAEPVLALPDPLTIDLSDDETVDASDIIRKMLDGARGIVDLTGEFGSAIDLDLTDDNKDETDKVLESWESDYSA